MLNQQQYETLLNTLKGNEELANIIKNSVALDDQLERLIIDITSNGLEDAVSQNPKAFVDAVLQNNGEVAKRAIDLIASNDQLKNAIINSINSKEDKACVDAVLQNNGEVIKKIIDIVASDQLKNSIISSIDNQNSKALVNAVLQNNGEVIKKIIDIVASDQLKNSIISSIDNQNSKALVNAVLQNNGEVIKKIIDIVASDQLKNSIISSIGDENLKALVDTALQNNGEVAKSYIDLVTSNDQLKNAVYEGINDKNPGKAIEKIMSVIISDIENGKKPLASLGKDTNQNKKVPPQSSNGGKPSTFLGKLSEHKGKIAISVLLTGGAVTAFVLGQPIIGAIVAVAAIIAVGILMSEVYKQTECNRGECTRNDNNAGSVLNDTTLSSVAGIGK